MKKIQLLTEGVKFRIAQGEGDDIMEIDRSQNTPNNVSLFVRHHYIKDHSCRPPIWTAQFAFWITNIRKNKIKIERNIGGTQVIGFIKLSDITLL